MAENKSKIHVAMVSYLNSKPFEYGILQSGGGADFELHLATPADCASMFEKGKVDIALVPVGALADIEDYEIVSDYCIACDGEVRTVCIFSDTPLENCSTIFLDDHSRTSFLLAQVLTEQYYGRKVIFKSANVEEINPGLGEAVLMIGDKVFEAEQKFRYKYDLGRIWKDWTGLAFVFAVWVARRGVQPEIILNLNNRLEYGVKNVDKVISQLNSESLDLISYFRQNIQYVLDGEKQKALELFRQKCGILKSRFEEVR